MTAPFSEEFQARYARLTPLGEGGMAVVYRAREVLLDRDVAIKVLKRLERDQEARFRREARSLAALDHPNVLRVYDADCDGTLPYLVCELIDGQSLDQLARTTPLDRAGALRATQEVGAALAYVHGRGIVHRDVKAENVLVTRAGVHKLADFGLARPLASGHTVTAADIVMGTPEYLAPEIVLGASPAPAADQYALGVMLYWLLTQRFPFTGDSPGDLLRARLESDPRPPSAHADVPAELERVILKMLARDPDARFESVAAACATLDGKPGARAGARSRPGAPARGSPAARASARTIVAPLRPLPASRPRLLAAVAGALVCVIAAALALKPSPEMTHASSASPGGPAPLASATPLVVAPPSPAAIAPGYTVATTILRFPSYRRNDLSIPELKKLAVLTGIDLGTSAKLHRHWFDFAEWIEGRRAALPRYSLAQSDEIHPLHEPLFMKAMTDVTMRELATNASFAVQFASTYPEDPRPWLLLGRVLTLDKHPAEAERAFARARAAKFQCGGMDWPVMLAAAQVQLMLYGAHADEDGLFAQIAACPKLARNAFLGIHAVTGDVDPARCERLLRRGMTVPGQEGNAAIALSVFLAKWRAAFAEARGLLQSILARDPGAEDVRHRLLDIAWERGDEAAARALSPPVDVGSYQHRTLLPLVFPQRPGPPDVLDVGRRDDEVYVRNAYFVRWIEAGRPENASRAILEVRERLNGYEATVHRYDVYLHDHGLTPDDRLESMRRALTDGHTGLWSELAGQVSRNPTGPDAKLLEEMGGTGAKAWARVQLAQALAKSRRGEHDAAMTQFEAIGRSALVDVPASLILEVFARAIYASGEPESAASKRARAFHLWDPNPEHDAEMQRVQKLAAALWERRLEDAGRQAEELYNLNPEVCVYGWVAFADARDRRHDAGAARFWARRLSASARALAVNVWQLPELAKSQE